MARVARKLTSENYNAARTVQVLTLIWIMPLRLGNYRGWELGSVEWYASAAQENFKFADVNAVAVSKLCTICASRRL